MQRKPTATYLGSVKGRRQEAPKMPRFV